jgi:hypothetical protein
MSITPNPTGKAAISSMREYERNGTANLFMLFAPLEGWRHIKVTDRHSAIDYAHVPRDLADIHFAQKRTIVLVQDNLNIHSKASLNEAFPPAEARQLVDTTGSSRWSSSTATIASSVGLEASSGTVTTSLTSNSRALAMMKQSLSAGIDRSGVSSGMSSAGSPPDHGTSA